MQLQREKDSGKNNENCTDVTLNINTDFTFYFLILQKCSKINFLKLLPSTFLIIMYIRLSYILFITLSLSRFCRYSKSRRNQSIDWHCRIPFWLFLTETLSQTDMSLFGASLVVFFQQNFPERDRYTGHIGF